MIYVLEAVGCERFKVGYTKDIHQFLHHRLITLQVACPFPLCLRAFKLDGTKYQERALLDEMKLRRVTGEWFRWNHRLAHFVRCHKGELWQLKAQHEAQHQIHSMEQMRKLNGMAFFQEPTQ